MLPTQKAFKLPQKKMGLIIFVTQRSPTTFRSGKPNNQLEVLGPTIHLPFVHARQGSQFPGCPQKKEEDPEKKPPFGFPHRGRYPRETRGECNEW
ncbi:hypothetical protein TNIN_411311 [Trichonephila inaurata madagascariensis]|uniref:Uncharacterized protein n=1 Tax=Trichonephila inaurata madagascariensis TaxID=2747483 RepID=A0A8X7C8F9_9ARAC|nr:hypothetical protein TNIN_411311 [Trichonephila inaurata madagascariensis]